ncbi:hypothetical protein K504DRAFT_486533 [Pleomassaria siparia CBS 279.74]|uniref:SAP domain-containing protein n=1 Tax=Pleomassaria siparia CBS 279.74 TaxID=1314801 RepID=A0A6G1KPF8_9PLEO|nr:hypothetical protein K504DRAFT_486533 [Pleomassaria siparia CBS 279.74]
MSQPIRAGLETSNRSPLWSVTQFVDLLPAVELSDIAANERRCSYCWIDFGDTQGLDDLDDLNSHVENVKHLRELPFDQSRFCNDPVCLYCPAQHLFEKSCLINILTKVNTRCPLCQHEMSGFAQILLNHADVTALSLRQIRHLSDEELDICRHRLTIIPKLMLQDWCQEWRHEMKRCQRKDEPFFVSVKDYETIKYCVTRVLDKLAWRRHPSISGAVPSQIRAIGEMVMGKLGSKDIQLDSPMLEQCLSTSLRTMLRTHALAQKYNTVSSYMHQEVAITRRTLRVVVLSDGRLWDPAVQLPLLYGVGCQDLFDSNVYLTSPQLEAKKMLRYWRGEVRYLRRQLHKMKGMSVSGVISPDKFDVMKAPILAKYAETVKRKIDIAKAHGIDIVIYPDPMTRESGGILLFLFFFYATILTRIHPHQLRSMTDYSKSTVAALRQLLKDRGIPSTGLTRKAQIIEKLVAQDKARNGTTEESEATGAVAGSEATPASAEPQVAQATYDEPVPAKGGHVFHLNEAHGTKMPSVTSEQTIVEPIINASSEPPTQSQPRPTLETAVENPPEEQTISTETIPQMEENAPGATVEQLAPVAAPTVMEEQLAPVAEVAPTVTEEQSATVITDVPADQPASANQEKEPSATETQPTNTISELMPGFEPARVSQPEPQTQTDTEMEVNTASPDPNEKPSVEKAELLPIPEGSVDTTAEVSRLNTEELEVDTRKRKRRSQSPDVPSQDIRAKKARPSTDVAPEVHLKEDEDIVMQQRQPETELETVVEDVNGAELKTEEVTVPKSPIPEPNPSDPTVLEDSRLAPERKEKASRYKAAFEPAAPTPTTDDFPIDDRPIVRALHPATPAIYIRNFMRPLKPESLRQHLVSLATPPSTSPDDDILITLFLDSMKTHALVRFANTNAASRVRASLHGSIWPAEGNRKELWVDFVPEDTVESWINTEDNAMNAEKAARISGAPIPAKRFEVVYPESDGGVRAVHQEMGASNVNNNSAPLNAPRGPKSQIEQRREVPLPPRQQYPVAPSEATRKHLGQSFETLESLFESTTAKPKLYYLPVDDARSNARLNDLDKETSRDWNPELKVKGLSMWELTTARGPRILAEEVSAADGEAEEVAADSGGIHIVVGEAEDIGADGDGGAELPRRCRCRRLDSFLCTIFFDALRNLGTLAGLGAEPAS